MCNKSSYNLVKNMLVMIINPNTFPLSYLRPDTIKRVVPTESNLGHLSHQSVDHPYQAISVMLPGQQSRTFTCIVPVVMT